MSTSQRTAYLWGPVSSFTGPLTAWLVKKGWNVHIATKSSLNLFSMSPLDLKSSALAALEESFGGRDKAKAFQDRFKIIDKQETGSGTRYDAVIFAGIPPNYDESRAPRAPWSVTELAAVIAQNKETPLFIISSIFGGVQQDGVVPEQFEFERRKPASNWESICQQYENKLLLELSGCEAPWYLVRMPILCGATEDGITASHTGLYPLLKRMSAVGEAEGDRRIALAFRPDSVFWFIPVDMATYVFWRYLEDSDRPRVLNLVATNPALNREWLPNAASASGVETVECQEEDGLDLPATLKKLLSDEVQVSTRNLFEVAGRYHVPPVKADHAYFKKVIDRARENNWGEPRATPGRTTGDEQTIAYSDSVVRYYFEDFLPGLLNTGGLMDKAISAGQEIGFQLKEASDLAFVLKNQGGESTAQRLPPEASRPKVCFILTGKTLLRLVQSKLPLHRALLLREVEVKGPIIKTMQVTSLVERFLKEHPLTKEHLSKAESQA